jgi:uncharacterized membrane protein
MSTTELFLTEIGRRPVVFGLGGARLLLLVAVLVLILVIIVLNRRNR